MISLKFYKISDIEVEDAFKKAWAPDDRDPVFVAIIDVDHLVQDFNISNKIVVREIVQSPDGGEGTYYIELLKNDKKIGFNILNIDKYMSLEISSSLFSYLNNKQPAGLDFGIEKISGGSKTEIKIEILKVLEKLIRITGRESQAAYKTAEEIFENYFESDREVSDA